MNNEQFYNEQKKRFKNLLKKQVPPTNEENLKYYNIAIEIMKEYFEKVDLHLDFEGYKNSFKESVSDISSAIDCIERNGFESYKTARNRACDALDKI